MAPAASEASDLNVIRPSWRGYNALRYLVILYVSAETMPDGIVTEYDFLLTIAAIRTRTSATCTTKSPRTLQTTPRWA